MDGDFLRRFESIVRHYPSAPLVDAAAALLAVKPASSSGKAASRVAVKPAVLASQSALPSSPSLSAESATVAKSA
jgi:hypothetical protein